MRDVFICLFTAQWVPKMTADANAGALDAGLDTALVFVDLCPVNVLRQIADAVCSNVVDKAFGTRANTLNKYAPIFPVIGHVLRLTAFRLNKGANNSS